MIGYLVSSKEGIKDIPKKVNVAVLRFRPSISMLIDIKRRGVKNVMIPKSQEQFVSQNMKKYATQIGLKVIVSQQDGRGRRSDIHGNFVELDEDYNIKEI